MPENLSHEALVPQPSKKLFEGSWAKGMSWSFYLSGKIPPQELCTAVSCIAILEPKGEMPKIILTKNKRGWEEIGGHIEDGETAVDAIRREAIEEGGFNIEHLRPIGFKQIVAEAPMPHEQEEGYYPFPVSFQPYFLATSSAQVTAPSGIEIFESEAFNLDQLPSEISTLDIIQAGIRVYREQLIVPE